MVSKTKVVVLYGGKSTEHEISCRSASFVVKNIDRDRYDLYAVGIDQDGSWHRQELSLLDQCQSSTLPIKKCSSPLNVGLDWRNPEGYLRSIVGIEDLKSKLICFPVLHGTYGEDGVVQGFLTMANVAYVGSGVLGSSVAMDKVVAKKLVHLAGIPVVPWLDVRSEEYERDSGSFLDSAEAKLPYPIFVKPACLGSSVGITKASNRIELDEACRLALSYDDKILLEQGLNVREIECGALGGYDPLISDPGEVSTAAGFYSYEAKYLNENEATIKVPAELELSQIESVKRICHKVYKELNLYGLARIDLFLDTKNHNFYFNEVNTLPGFTEISQYPMLWKAAGKSASELLEELIEVGLSRKERVDQLDRKLK
jgi:D-alanine-D-alanine ligase